MMQVGDQVVCIDGVFPGPLLKLYSQIPYAGVIYTIRAIYIAREKAHPLPSQDGGSDVGILLNELHNPSDPRHLGHGELGFRQDRFRLLNELKEENKKETCQQNLN